MGFKRSNEGRVFFQTLAEENENLKREARTGSVLPPSSNAKNDATQMQILTLLKALNAKLQSSQKDKESMQREIAATKEQLQIMQKRAESYETKAKTLEQSLQRGEAGSTQDVKNAQQMAREAIQEMEETRRLLLDIEERAERNEITLSKQKQAFTQKEQQIKAQQEKIEKMLQQEKREMEERFLLSEKKLLSGNKDFETRLLSAEKSRMNINKRLDDIETNTEKVERKIEKAMQDRSRLLRKLERIEETVLQTNEAMNARAMVLLTDQNTAAQSGHPQIPAHLRAELENVRNGNENSNSGLAWWQKKWRVDVFGAATAVVVVLLLGWGINELQRSAMYDTSGEVPLNEFIERQASADVMAENTNPSQDGTMLSNVTDTVSSTYQDFLESWQQTDMDESPVQEHALTENQTEQDVVKQETVAENAIQAQNMVSTDLGEKDDLGMIDVNNQEALVALLDENPDELAAILNKIEPSNIPPEENVASAQEAKVQMEQQVVAPEPNTTAQEPDATVQQPVQNSVVAITPERDFTPPAEFAKPSKPQTALDVRISKDNTLPPAIQEVQELAFAGSAEAQHDLAAIYTAGHGGVAQDYELAALWFEEAAHQGVANAQYNLGVMFHQGIGVEKNTKDAFRWYHTAAAQGHAEAQYNLGIAYIEGLGVPYDPERAAGYFESAAASGIMEAAYNLGLIYENGLLGESAPDQALVWYKQAADKGSPEAKTALETLAKNLGITLAEVNMLVDTMKKQARDSRAINREAVSAQEEANVQSTQPTNRNEFIAPMDDGTALIARIQEQLMARGLYPGPADGVNGMLTRDAVRSYQDQHGLEKTGEVSETLLSHMTRTATMQGSSFTVEGEGELGSREQ